MKNLLKYSIILSVAVIVTACSKNDSPNHYVEGSDKLITFSMSLSGRNPFGVREIQTNKEKEVKRIDVYQFDAAGILEAVYPDMLKVNVATGITVTIPVTGMSGIKDFIFIGNNTASTPGEADLSYSTGITDKATFMASVTKALTASVRLATPLLMTGMINGVDIDIPAANTTDPTAPLTVNVTLERVMSRIDLRNEETALTIESIQWINGNNKAPLFGNVPVAGIAGNANIITYPEITLPALTATTTANDPIHIIVTRNVDGNPENIKYEHILYPYPAVKEAEPKVLIKGYYTQQDGSTTAFIQEFELKVPDLTNPSAKEFLAPQRNFCYTLVLKKTYTGILNMTLFSVPWTDEDDIDHPFVPASISVSYPGGGTAIFDDTNNILTVDGTATSYDLNVTANTEWEVYYYTDSTTISADFTSLGINASSDKSDPGKTIEDILKITVKTAHTADTTYNLRLVSLTSPTTFKDITIVVDVP